LHAPNACMNETIKTDILRQAGTAGLLLLPNCDYCYYFRGLLLITP
jgi:hypothetical protein